MCKPITCPYCKVPFDIKKEPYNYGRNHPRIICMNCRYYSESKQENFIEKSRNKSIQNNNKTLEEILEKI